MKYYTYMIKAITFDLWNTIFSNIDYADIRLQFLIDLLNERKISYFYDELKQNYYKYFELSNRVFKTSTYHHIFLEDRISKLTDSLKIKLSKKDKKLIRERFELAIFEKPPPIIGGVREILDIFAPNYKIGLISDTGITPGYVLRKVMGDYDILDYFDVTIFSDEVGFYKPHPLIFKKALKKLKTSPEDAIHIGDLLETDIQGAKNYKMLAIWINDSFESRLSNVNPDYEISQLFEAVEIIRDLG